MSENTQVSVQISPELIGQYLKTLSEKGRSESSVRVYHWILTGFYDYLPGEKVITADTGSGWIDWMRERGFALRTISARISVWNNFVRYLGRREWVLDGIPGTQSAQPELTREEYLRLLEAAKQTGRERNYLLIKVMGGAGLRMQEIPQLTVETVQSGIVRLESQNGAQIRLLRLPEVLRRELLEYAGRQEVRTGPVFVTKKGKPLCRSGINHMICQIGSRAQVPPEKANPRCLRKMYQDTCAEMRADAVRLAEQAYERLLEEEQEAVGWNSS